MSKFAILLGGKIEATARLRRQLEGARVIAADAGIVHAETLALKPELWVGDFDSSSPHLERVFAEVPRQVHPVEKDASDGELAVSEALRREASSIILVGGFGGQVDHVLAHTNFLVALARRDVDIFMTSGNEEARGLVNELRLDDVTPGTRLSILPFTDMIGLSISGVRWPLQKKTVRLGSALTLSNIVEGVVEITLQHGHGVVVTYPR